MDSRTKISMLAEDIRPNRFDRLIGNGETVKRLTSLIAKNLFPPAIFIPGPTGSGKTTLGRIVARTKLCRERQPGEFEPCGRCPNCKVPLDDFVCGLECYEEIDAAIVTSERLAHWRHDVLRPDWVILVDELQDMPPPLMKQLRKLLEGCKSTIVLTTTHRDKIEDALLNRLKSYEYILRRPSTEDIVQFLDQRFRDLGIRYETKAQLVRIVEALNCEMRPCAEFPRKVFAETQNGQVTDTYLDHLFGASKDCVDYCSPRRRPLI